LSTAKCIESNTEDALLCCDAVPEDAARPMSVAEPFGRPDSTSGLAARLAGRELPPLVLLCLQLKRIALGSVLVLCFSIGLALTMVASGVIAALSVRYAERRFGGFGTLVRRAPYASGVLILCVGAYVALQGWQTLPPAG
jgi:nickel/cobalt exporter